MNELMTCNKKQRDTILIELGFSDYKEYCRSKLWRRIRTRVFNTNGKTCQQCPKAATTIYHSQYNADNLSGRSIAHLHQLCNECHTKEQARQTNHKKKKRRKKKHDAYLTTTKTTAWERNRKRLEKSSSKVKRSFWEIQRDNEMRAKA